MEPINKKNISLTNTNISDIKNRFVVLDNENVYFSMHLLDKLTCLDESDIQFLVNITKNVGLTLSSLHKLLLDLNSFSFKNRMCYNNCKIYSINSWFYVCNQFDKRIECYDINGKLVDTKDLANIYEEKNQNYSFGYFNKRFIIGPSETKKFKIL